MHFYATIPDFIGAIVIGFGLGLGWTAGCWVVEPIMRAIKG